MKILMLTSIPMTPPWDQGDKNLAYTLTSALAHHRFRVLTDRNGPAPAGENLDLEPVYNGRYPTLDQKARIFWRLLSRPHALAPDSRAVHADLVHMIYQPYTLSSWLLRALPELRRKPTLHTLPAAASGPLHRDLFFADKVVVLSEYARQKLGEMGLHNVVRIPSGIDTARWASLRSQRALCKARLGLEGRPIILFPGHYGPGQGGDVMLRAMPDIAALVPGAQVIFACRVRSPLDQEREQVVRHTLDQAGLLGSACFFTTVPDMSTLIGAADVVALPLETMKDKVDIPTTLLEALAAGTPVVITDIPPMRELVALDQGPGGCSSSQVGRIVPPGDSKSLAQALAEILLDSGLRERMGDRGQELARDCYDIAQVARWYEALYRDMS